MRSVLYLFLLIILSSFQTLNHNEIADPKVYLKDVKKQLTIEWPKNKTINLVFHGHSVPAGYFKTPDVRTFEAYPFQVLKELKKLYPYAVINVINTSIGGEHSKNGEKRFTADVLTHKPDVLFIDYVLNDKGLGIDKAKEAWESMIKQALEKNIKVILLSPSPHQNYNIMDSDTYLDQHTTQIVEALAKKYNIGFVNSYGLFKKVITSRDSVVNYMSQVNHPNERGHGVIAKGIMEYFN